jgi:hypothetical protein
MTAATSPGSFTKYVGFSTQYSTTSAHSPHTLSPPPYASSATHFAIHSVSNAQFFRPTRSSAYTCSTQTRLAPSRSTRTTNSRCSAERTPTSPMMHRVSQAGYSSAWAPRNLRSLRRRRPLLLGRIFSTAVHPLRAPRVFLGLGGLGLAFWFCAPRFSRWLSDNRDSFSSL